MNNFVLALLAPASFLLTALVQGKQFETIDLVAATGCYFATVGAYYMIDWLTR